MTIRSVPKQYRYSVPGDILADNHAVVNTDENYPIDLEDKKFQPHLMERVHAYDALKNDFMEEIVLVQKSATIPAKIPPDSSYGGKLRRLCRNPSMYLYAAKFFQSLGDRMWIYSGPLLLLSLRPDTLMLPALYGFVTGISAIIFGPLFGEWIDEKPRLYAATITTVMQNGFLGFAALLLGTAILLRNSMEEFTLMFCVAGLILLSFVANIFYATSLVIIEKDWVAVIAANDKTKLARMIATIRRIELIVQILCPLVMAQVLLLGNGAASIVIGSWSLLTIVIEYIFLRLTWQLTPAMLDKPDQLLISKQTGDQNKCISAKIFKTCYSIYNGWAVFSRNRVGIAAFAVTLLEWNVIVFNGVTCGYAVTQGFSTTVIALLVGGDALAGVISTFVFPVTRHRISLEKIGIVAMVILFLSHAVCVTTNWLPGSPFDPQRMFDGYDLPSEPVPVTNETAYYYNLGLAVISGVDGPTSNYFFDLIQHPLTAMVVFSAFLTVGRFAYGIMELTGSQLLLENTTDEERGAVCAVQYSLKQVFVRLTYLSAIILPWPETFGILVILSFCSTTLSLLLFVYYYRKLPTRIVA